MDSRPILLAFNRGLVSRHALTRVDLKRMALSAETQTNWLPRVLGPMTLRNGTRLIRETRNNLPAAHIPFVYAVDDVAVLELTDLTMRVAINDVLITRPDVGTDTVDGAFLVEPDTTTVTATIAAPAVLTYAGADIYANGDPIYFTTSGALPTGLVANAAYYVRNLVQTSKTFNVSSTPTSTVITTTGSQSGVHTLHGGGGEAATTATISVAAPGAVVYAGNDIFTENDPVRLSTTGTLPTPLTTTTLYYIKGLVAGTNTTNLSLTPGGAAIDTTVAGTGVHTVRRVSSAWSDSDEPGAVSAILPAAQLSLLGTGTNYAIRDQALTIAPADQNVEHALDIVVARGAIELSVGTTFSGTNLVSAMKLRTGSHSIAFTPTTGTVYVRLAANDTTAALVDSCAVASAGAMSLTTPWTAAALPTVRFDQSGDVIFTASSAARQQRIERQASRSWSVVNYLSEDGPFRSENLSTIRMSVAALTGSTTLTASRDYFTANNVGSLFRLGSAGQTVASTLTAEDTYTSYIRVTGVSAGRSFAISLTGTWVGTLTLQRSVTDPGDWTTVTTYTTATSTTYDDTLANQTIYYRIGFRAGAFTSGSCVASLIYSSGTIEGVGLVTAYTSPTAVSIDVLKDFGSTSTTASWWEGAWSPRRGWPSSVVLHDGRLWWAGKDRIAGSVSDAFDSFDDSTEGDSGPIFRTIGAGPVDTINWLVSLSSLIVGGQGREFVAKASTLDEPLTPTAFSLKTAGTLGSAAVRAVQLDASAVYVHRNGSRVYEIALDGSTYNYVSSDLTAVIPELGDAGFTRIAIQRTPDTRIHCVRADGKVAILIFDRVEKVTCWVLYETDGVVEDVIVTPTASDHDQVYYTVARTINGSTKRFFEKWSLDSETLGAATTVLSDASIEYSGVSTATITGLSSLEGESVVVWGNGKDLGTYTVASGSITLSEAVTYACVGLAYTARFKGSRFAEASEIALGQKQQIHHVGLLLADTHAQGIRFGQDFDHLDNLPQIENGLQVDQDSIWTDYVLDSIPINGTWANDTRLCLEASSPRPATVLAAVVSVTGHGK